MGVYVIVDVYLYVSVMFALCVVDVIVDLGA